MYVAIRRFEGVHDKSEELAQVARQLAAGLSRAPGFVSFLMVEAGTGVLATVSIFEDEASLEESDRLAVASLPDHFASLLPKPAQSTIGEMIFQKGL